MKELAKYTLRNNKIDLIAVDEIFTQIPKWSSYYISNYGRLIHVNTKNRYNIVNPSITTNGYLLYTLSKPARTYNGKKVRRKNGKPKNTRETKYAHRLVAELYVSSQYPSEYKIADMQTHHKDHNHANNYFQNLMWLTTKDHAFVDTIKQIAVYNPDRDRFYTYSDIELLAKRAGVNVLELIDILRYNDKLNTVKGLDIYKVNDLYVGVKYYKSNRRGGK